MRTLTLAVTTDVPRVAEALALVRSFGRAHPGAAAVVVVADAVSVAGVDAPDVELLTGRDLLGPRIDLLAAALAPDDLVRAMLPALLRRAAAPVVALAHDGEVHAPLALSADGGLLVFATGEDEVGVVDDGAVAIMGGNGSEALDWWDERVAALDVAGLPGAAAARFADVALVRDPAFAVAAWNAAARGVRDDGGRLVLGDGSPVTWARYTADEDHAAALDPAAPLGAAFAAHRAVAHDVARTLPPLERLASDLPDGTPLTGRLRELFAEGVLAGALDAAPFDTSGFEAFQRYLDAPPDDDPRAGGVSRYLFRLWSDRADLQAVYRDLREAGDRHGFLGWAAVHGAAEVPVPAWLLPEDRLPEREGLGGPPPVGVNVAGYFQSELGVGEAARRTVRALDAAHVPLLPVQPQTVPATRRGHPYGVTSPAAAPFPFNLVCVNADGLPAFAREVGDAFFADRHTVGSWWWELPTFPERYHDAFAHVDEVWVGTRYVHDAIAPVAPVPVLHMPVPVTRPVLQARTRAELGLPEGFLVGLVLDFNSVLARKNPIGLIEAFTRAFPPGSGASLVLKTANGHLHPRDRLRLSLAARRHPDVHLLERQLSAADRDALIASCDLYASLHRSEGFGLTLAEAMALEVPTLATAWSGNLDFMHPETTHLVPFELVDVGEGNAPYDPDSRWAEPDLDAAAAAMVAVREGPQEARRKARAAAERLLDDHAPEAVGAVMRARLEALAPRIADRSAARARTRRAGVGVDDALAGAQDRVALRAGNDAAQGHNPLRTRARGALIKASRPVVENQRAIDGAVLDALRAVADELSARIDEAVAAHGELSSATLASQRRLEDVLARLVAEGARPPSPGATDR